MWTSRRCGQLAVAAWSALVLLWLADVGGLFSALWLSRTLALLALLLTAAGLWGLGRFISPEHRPQGPLLAALLTVGVVVGMSGLGHEVGRGYYTDEGHYLHHANEVNSGKPFTRSFVYPHLTYYLDAFALWLAGLFPDTVAWFAGAVYGVEEAAAVPWLVLRLVTAALGVGTAVPVFLLALSVAGPLAAGLAGALVLFAVDYQEGYQVNISDVPSAAFAALALMFAGRLLDGERTRDYLLAGAASGLAAAAKYPAGVVAVGIVAVWVVHRYRRRRWGWGILWAGLASLGVFLLANPSLFVHPDAALHGPRGFLFGVRQYARGGWVGVTPDSNTFYYLGQILANFRWPVVVLAAAGLFALEPAARRRLALLAPFPLAFFLLISSMNMVVVRNLFPVIPALAVFLGVAAAGLGRLAASWAPRRRRLAAAGLAVAALAWPAAAAVRQTVTLVRPSTRDLMTAWVRENVPTGAGILKESYTPDFSPLEYRTVERRFAFRIPDKHFAGPRFDYLLLAGSAYGRWLRPENADRPHGDWYRRVFETNRLAHGVDPGPWRRGPYLRLYRLARSEPLLRERIFLAQHAFLTHPSMAGEDEILFTPNGRRAVFSASIAAGRYRLEPDGQFLGEGGLRVRALDDGPAVEARLGGGGGEVTIPGSGKTFFEVGWPSGSRLRRLAITRLE